MVPPSANCNSVQTEGDASALEEWLRARLQDERQCIERRHRALLVQFRKQVSSPSVALEKGDSSLDQGALATFACPVSQEPGPCHPRHSQRATSALEHYEAVPVSVPRLSPMAIHGAAPAEDEKTEAETKEDAAPRFGWFTGAAPAEDEKTQAETKEDAAPRFGWFTAAKKEEQEGDKNASEKAEMVETASPISAWGRFEAFVNSPDFELGSLVVIMLNALFMAAQQQYAGNAVGYYIAYPNYETPPDEQFPWAEKVFYYLESIFCAIFVAEILVKLLGKRLKWFRDPWNYFDLVIVGLSVFSLFYPATVSGNGGKITYSRLARFARMSRIVVKTKRSSNKFEMLKTLVTAVTGCASILFWALMIICFLQCLAGMSIGIIVEPFLLEDERWVDKADKRELVFEYYGTWWRAMLTMFQVSLANWAPPCRILFEHVDQAFSSFFLFYRCVIGFAVLSVVQAVFIQQTMKSMNSDKDLAIQKKQAQKEAELMKFRAVFERLDTNCNGVLSWDEFQALLDDDRMKATIGILDLDESDLRIIFDMQANGDRTVSWDGLCQGIHHIRGEARSLDMVTALAIVRRMEGKLENFENFVHPHCGFEWWRVPQPKKNGCGGHCSEGWCIC